MTGNSFFPKNPILNAKPEKNEMTNLFDQSKVCNGDMHDLSESYD